MERDTLVLSQTQFMQISTHALTWSATSIISSSTPSLPHFNSRAHVERDPAVPTIPSATTDFNSRAHVERDLFEFEYLMISEISTHALTWSATLSFISSEILRLISTHALTWSATRHQT